MRVKPISFPYPQGVRAGGLCALCCRDFSRQADWPLEQMVMPYLQRRGVVEME